MDTITLLHNGSLFLSIFTLVSSITAFSYYYKGKWMNYDHILCFINPQIQNKINLKYSIVHPPNLFIKNQKNENFPYRFIKQTKIQGGFSDHLPVKLKIKLRGKNCISK